MKILFFADTHLGNYRYPIKPYIAESMVQITDIADEEQPDLVVFAGDAFRTKVPSAGDIAEFGEFVYALSNGGSRTVIMIPGNHDTLGSGVTTLDVYSGYRNVYVMKEPDTWMLPLDPAPSRTVSLVTMPWLPSKALASSGLEGEDTAGAQGAILQLLNKRIDSNVKILVAHATALGTEYHDGVSTVLGGEVLWTNDMFEDFDLAVLGHIHNPQQITDNAYYVGSICPVSFNEANQNKRVIMWEDGHVHSIPLDAPNFMNVKVEDFDVYGMEDEYKDMFIRIVKGPDQVDPDIPECIWYEIVNTAPARDIRARIEDGMQLGTQEAIRQWLTINDVDSGESRLVMEALEEIMA